MDRSFGPSFDRRYLVLEQAFRVRSDLPRAGALIDRYLAAFRSRTEADGPTYVLTERRGRYPFVLYRDGRRLQSAPSFLDLVDYVLATVHQAPLERTESVIAVHAAAASWRDQGLVFPAPMDSGKTTLVAGLVRAGFDYLTDEAALLDARTGRLLPFPKTLWMEASSVRAFPELSRKLPIEYRDLSRLRTYVRPGDLRPNPTGGPCWVRFVIAPSYRKGADTRLEPISRAQALMKLARNSFNFKRFGGGGLAILRSALAGAQCYELQMGDLDSAIRAVQAVSQGMATVA